MNNKKNILIINGRYLPGYKDGGPVRSIKNLVDYLGDEYNFKILTCDRDHGDTERYSNIKVNKWNKVGKAQVYYVEPNGFKFSVIKNLSKQADLIYCCGCFDKYSIKTLILKRINLIKIPVVIASMGLFSPMEFRRKYFKKKLFITLFNLIGMFKNIYWSATSQIEIEHIKQQVRVKDNLFIAEDLPRKIDEKEIIKEKEVGKLKIVWISRIAPKKNLKGAIQILQKVKGDIEFTIYGPKHVPEYWDECEEELNRLPDNVKWQWKGSIDSENVVETLKEHHVFLFPTLGENYGHVIQEALSAGCPVILSDQTPWNDIKKYDFGYIYKISDVENYRISLEKYINMNENEFNLISKRARKYIIYNGKDKVSNSGYRAIFNTINLLS